MGHDFYKEKILPYASIIIKICRAYTNTNQDYEDYYQEVCLQIWRSKNNFQGKSEWATWIYKISLNVCITLSKKDKNMRHLPIVDDGNLPPGNKVPIYSDNDLNELYSAIKKLSAIDRAIILLHLEQRPYKEIAEIMNTNANNIGVKVKRIKKRLKILITDKINKT